MLVEISHDDLAGVDDDDALDMFADSLDDKPGQVKELFSLNYIIIIHKNANVTSMYKSNRFS